MKKYSLIITIMTLLLLIAGSSMAAKGRKLPIGAYIKSAKIDIISGDMDRYPEAVAMLDSLFLHYGPHAEALSLMGAIMVDYIDKTPAPDKRIGYVERLVAYHDSLIMCCNNEEIKDKYRDDCDEYIEKSDSTLVKYWREIYNNAVAQLKEIEEYQTDKANETDSAMIARYDEFIQETVDSCSTNLQMCIMLDPADEKSYVGMGSMYEKIGDYEKAIEWMKKGVEKTDNKSQLLVSIAYNSYNVQDFCGAAEYLQQYIDEFAPEDTVNMANLVIFYNNCDKEEEALTVNDRLLELNPDYVDALTFKGNYFNKLRAEANDSSKAYQDAGEDVKAKEWREKSDEMIDSSLVYYERAAMLSPEDEITWEIYATYLAIREQWEKAASAFGKMTELKPNDDKSWIYYGDCNIRLKNYEEALVAFQKAAEINPNDKETWEQLAALYGELGQKDKKAEAQAKADKL